MMTTETKHTANARAGFSLVELLLGSTLMIMFLLAFGRVFASSESLAQDSRMTLRANEDLRRNLEAVANVLRDADFDTLEGFDLSGEATTPSFARVTGADAYGKTYGSVESIAWRPAAAPVRGVARPGYLVHVVDGEETVIADRVPAYGFKLVMEDGTLVIRISTYYAVDGAHTQVHGATGVALRN
jgi:hypothetical protein